MGFWGTLLVCRSPVIPRAGAEPVDDFVWPAWRIRSEAPDLAGTFLAAEIYDSDGARIIAESRPSGRWATYLHLDRVLGHQVLPPSPFGSDGNELTGEALAEQNAEYQRELVETRRRYVANHLMGVAAARRAVTWANESGLTPASIEDVHLVLDSVEVFVEDLFHRLADGLGLLRK